MSEARRLPRNIHTHEHGAGRQPPWWMLLPAYTLLPLLRSPVGYTLAQPFPAFITALLVAFVPGIAWFLFFGLRHEELPANFHQEWLIGFAGLYFVADCVVFFKRARGMRTGEKVHSEEAGYSELTYRTDLPVPLCEMLLMPLAIGAAGWIVARSLSFALGWWLIVCAFSYLAMAYWEHSLRWARRRQPIDGAIYTQAFSDDIEEHEAQAQAYGRRRADGPDASRWTGTARPDRAEAAGKGRPRRPQQPQQSGQPTRTAYPPATPPDSAGWSSGTQSIAADAMAWLRRRRGR